MAKVIMHNPQGYIWETQTNEINVSYGPGLTNFGPYSRSASISVFPVGMSITRQIYFHGQSRRWKMVGDEGLEPPTSSL